MNIKRLYNKYTLFMVNLIVGYLMINNYNENSTFSFIMISYITIIGIYLILNNISLIWLNKVLNKSSTYDNGYCPGIIKYYNSPNRGTDIALALILLCVSLSKIFPGLISLLLLTLSIASIGTIIIITSKLYIYKSIYLID